MAEGIYGALGDPIPSASIEQQETYERGRQVALRRFLPSDGLGPNANVSFCGSCHEKPVIGGSGPRYRDFYIVGEKLAAGARSSSAVHEDLAFLTPYSGFPSARAPKAEEMRLWKAADFAVPTFDYDEVLDPASDANLNCSSRCSTTAAR